jgi:hypothetical protein
MLGGAARVGEEQGDGQGYVYGNGDGYGYGYGGRAGLEPGGPGATLERGAP